MTIRRWFRNFDWISIGLILSILSIGLLFVFSATSKDTTLYSSFFKKQLFGACTGIGIYLVLSYMDLDTICRWSVVGYMVGLLLLVYTIFCGFIGMGAKRWISLYVIKFQPSEIIKCVMPLAFAFYFNEQKNLHYKPLPFSKFLLPLSVLMVSFVLILRQPDLGTALIILGSGIILVWINNIPKSFFILSAIVLLLGAPVMWKHLKPYQKQRVLVLFGYGSDKNERYQVEQSKIAIGSGGLFGKGLMKGTQNRLSFLPEARTDFIFSVLCEEWGLMGALLILLLFALLFIRLGYVILSSNKLLDQLCGIGLLTPILLSTVVNIGMVIGILPTVGIPLPLFTYGITHLWITFANLGILNNISMRRFTLH